MRPINVKEISKQEFADIEIYAYRGKRQTLHTDSIISIELNLADIDGIPGDRYELDEQEYNDTVLANGGIYADFDAWYGDSNAKVCVIVLTESYSDYLR